MMTEIPAVRGFIRMCTDGWEQGWHERNGGNLTYRMRPEGVEQCRPYFRTPSVLHRAARVEQHGRAGR